MINFTVGPVQSKKEILEMGSEQTPYFRTPEFSNVMMESESMMNGLLNAPEGARTVFITGSGTASMDAVVSNILTKEDHVLIVDGGTFGHRFVEICDVYGIQYETIALGFGRTLHEDDLTALDGKRFSAVLVNADETSSGTAYDLGMLGRFCQQHDAVFIVDAISAFLADPIDMGGMRIDVVITGSQKAIACPPGISTITLSKRALDRVTSNVPRNYYLDIGRALKDGERGQTPFTPAVTILLQMHERLKSIVGNGGAQHEISVVSARAERFREALKDLPFEMVSERPSNAVTCLSCPGIGAKWLFDTMKDEYGIWICPNGGELSDRVFRIGHIGELSDEECDTLIESFGQLKREGRI